MEKAFNCYEKRLLLLYKSKIKNSKQKQLYNREELMETMEEVWTHKQWNFRNLVNKLGIGVEDGVDAKMEGRMLIYTLTQLNLFNR